MGVNKFLAELLRKKARFVLTIAPLHNEKIKYNIERSLRSVSDQYSDSV